MRNVNKELELQYLLEDPKKDLAKLPDEIYVGPIEKEIIDKLNKKLEQLQTIQIGQSQVLASIQNILVEFRVGLEEREMGYVLITKMIDDLKDYLDWQDNWT